MKKVIIVSNEAQACGKTTLALLIEQYLTRRQFKTARAITHLDQELPSKAELLDLEEPFNMQDLADMLHDNDVVIVDAQTASKGRLGQQLKDGGIEEILAELDAELSVVIPICDDAHVLQGARDAAEEFSGLGEFVAVSMPLASDVPAPFVGSSAEKVLRLLGTTFVNLASPTDDTMEAIVEMDLDLPLSLTQRSLLPRFLTHQLLVWEVACGEMFKECENCLQPMKPKPTDHDESSYGRVLVRSFLAAQIVHGINDVLLGDRFAHMGFA